MFRATETPSKERPAEGPASQVVEGRRREGAIRPVNARGGEGFLEAHWQASGLARRQRLKEGRPLRGFTIEAAEPP